VKELHDITLLYVEDNFDAQETLQLLLEDEVKDLYQAFNGKDALEFYYTKQPDIIITDINMPHMDGLSFAQKIKEINEDQPIIIISGYDNRENLLHSIDIGIDQFLTKPIDIELLLEKIDKIIHKSNKTRKKTQMAYYDNLTNIYNRHFFDLKLEKAIQESKTKKTILALFFIDLDDFKTINDSYGHTIGDMVLKRVATNLKTLVEDEDILARIGGDEFAIIVETNNNAEIQRLQKRIAEATNFTLEFHIDISSLYVDTSSEFIKISCSTGLCILCEKCSSKEEFMHCADLAMYKEKKSSKKQ